jgi:hypothetical protein
LHGYALAVLLRANPIYIIGVELPSTYENYKHYKNFFSRRENLFSKILRIFRDHIYISKSRLTDFGLTGQESILRDFQSIAAIASQLGIATYSLSQTSALNQVIGVNHLPITACPEFSAHARS